MRVWFRVYETVTVAGDSGKIIKIDGTRGYLVSFEADLMEVWYTATEAGRLFNK